MQVLQISQPISPVRMRDEDVSASLAQMKTDDLEKGAAEINFVFSGVLGGIVRQ